MRIFAILPAAGLSSRMGRPKLGLPLGGRTVLERVLDAVQSAGVDDILVVLGPQAANLEPLAQTAKARTLLLAKQTPDMRATIQEGLAWLEVHERPGDSDAFLLLPADHPTLRPEAIKLLITASRGQAASIFIPTYEGRRGHPTLIAWRHVAGIRQFPPEQGLNSYLRAHADETLEVPCAHPDILCDLDTPGEYERLRRSYS
jgi:molybdenum cofactor cytidylyltransferase